MSGIKTCGQLVGIVRAESQETLSADATGRLRVVDGYTSALAGYATGATSIVDILNYVLGDMAADTQFNKCYFDLALTAATGEYLFDRDAADIEQMYLTDSALTGRTFPLTKTSIAELDRRFDGPQWRNRTASRPLEYYTIGTRAVGFFPVPSGSTLTATYLASATVADMTEATDIPAVIRDSGGSIVLNTDGDPESALPAQFHDLIAIGAAARLARMQGDNKTQASMLTGEYEKGKRQLRALVNGRQETDTKPLGLRTGRRFSRKSASGGRWGRGWGML